MPLICLLGFLATCDSVNVISPVNDSVSVLLQLEPMILLTNKNRVNDIDNSYFF